jgi:cysteine desulfurase
VKPRPAIYVDYAATTPVDPRVLEVMLPYFTETFGNPSGIHSFSQAARDAVEDSRRSIAQRLGAVNPKELIFTSGGTESNNLILEGVAKSVGKSGDRILCSSIEHSAIEKPLVKLKQDGFDVVTVDVNEHGILSIEDLKQKLTENTILVSVMMINNEVGSIQPIAEVGELLASHRAIFHSDTVQAVRATPIDVNSLHLDALSLSAHKFYGPKGIGALWVRSGTELSASVLGGGQERGLRSGTENVPGIVGMARAFELTEIERGEAELRQRDLTNKLLSVLPEAIPGCEITGHPVLRHPAIASFVLAGVEGESLMIQLDRLGIAASTGSACSTKTRRSSRILEAMGIDHMRARGSLRLSLGRHTKEEDVDMVIECVVQAVESARNS